MTSKPRDLAATQPVVRIVTWNLQRKKPTTPTGSAAVKQLQTANADVMVLTEARTTHLSGEGHAIYPDPQSWGKFADDERKVSLWSKNPWTHVDTIGTKNLFPGRFVAATTHTPLGKLRVIGVCIPWHMAKLEDEVTASPWKHHNTYWALLGELLRDDNQNLPVVVAGDFNQRVPRRSYGNHKAAEERAKALEGFEVITQGTIDGCARPGIDHIAIGGLLSRKSVHGWSNDYGETRMSDHDAAVADLIRTRSSGV